MKGLTGYNLFLKHALKYGFSLFGLPKTGQIISYADYDDGYYKKGYPKSGARFKDNGDGTISDLATGLMWQQESDNISRNWSDTITYVHSLSLGGYSDWRLPNLKELLSIVDYSKSNPAIDTDFFLDFIIMRYWTSTTLSTPLTSAWVVYFSTGSTATFNKISANWLVLAVRGGA